MKRVIAASIAAAALAGAGCAEETTAYCGEACDIWERCVGWDREVCMGECQSEADWDEDYMSCLRAQSCETLDACE